MKRNQSIEMLLPWYEAGSLEPEERARVEGWLRLNPQAQADLQRMRALKEAVQSEGQQKPRSAVLPALRTRVQHTRQARRMPGWLQAFWSLALALACALLLWGVWQPGVTLVWQAPVEAWTAFRVYRAPLGSTDFMLLEEIPVSRAAEAYRYTDSHLWPGGDYVYRVEGVTAQGLVVLSDVTTADGSIFLIQLGSILLFSAGLGLFGWLLLPRSLLASRLVGELV